VLLLPFCWTCWTCLHESWQFGRLVAAAVCRSWRLISQSSPRPWLSGSLSGWRRRLAGSPPLPLTSHRAPLAASRSVWPQPSPPEQHPSILPGHVDCPPSSPRTSSPQPDHTSYLIATPAPDPSPFLAQARRWRGPSPLANLHRRPLPSSCHGERHRLEEHQARSPHGSRLASPSTTLAVVASTLPVLSGAPAHAHTTQPLPPKLGANASNPRRRTSSLLTLELHAVNTVAAVPPRRSPHRHRLPALGHNVAEHGPSTRRRALPTSAAEQKPAILAIARSTG
jgi:hypothetical protein